MKPRSRFGNDVADNLISLCASCHSKCHGERRQKRRAQQGKRNGVSPLGFEPRTNGCFNKSYGVDSFSL